MKYSLNNNEAISSLKQLRDRIIECAESKAEFDKAAEELKKAESRQPVAVNVFDQEHKQAYVISHIGEEPVKPKGIIKLAVPIYRAKKKAYEKEYEEYIAEYNKCISAYYEEYEEQRSKLQSEECSVIEYEIQAAAQQYDSAEENYKYHCQELDADLTVSEKLKKIEVVDALIGYFQDQRADNLKEAINLFYEEEHRRKLEEFAQEQVRLSAEAAEFARQAAESAEDAAQSAEEAISRVDSAMERANEAYERAEEAYNEAQNAYWAASSTDD